MKIHIEENDKPLTKEQIKELTKIKIPKYRMLKGCKGIFKPNYSVWKQENKND